MPTPTKGHRLGAGPAHERLMLANLATSLFEHDRITTTEAKAKRLRPLAERLITFAKRGDLHARRQVMTVVRDKDVVHKLFAEIGPKSAPRKAATKRTAEIAEDAKAESPTAASVAEAAAESQVVIAADDAEADAAEADVDVDETAETAEADVDETAEAEADDADE